MKKIYLSCKLLAQDFGMSTVKHAEGEKTTDSSAKTKKAYMYFPHRLSFADSPFRRVTICNRRYLVTI